MKIKNSATKLLSAIGSRRDHGGLNVSEVVVQEFSKGVMTGELVPESVDLENRSIEVIFTTGEAGARYHWDIGDYIEELDVTESSIRTARLDKGLSVCDNHDTRTGCKGVYGISKPTVNGVKSYTIANGELRGIVVFSDDPESDIVWQKVANGTLRHWSLGYDVHEFDAKIKEGQPPVYRAVDWTPLELSIVPVSFETTNGSRTKPKSGLVRAKVNHLEEQDDMKTQRNGQGLINDPQDGGGTTNPAELTTQRTAEVPTPAVAPTPAPVQLDLQAALTARSAEQTRLTSMCRNMKIDDSIVSDGFAKGLSSEGIRAAILDAAEQRSIATNPGAATGGEGGQGGANVATGKEHNQRAMENEGITQLLLSRTSGNGGLEVNDFGRQFVGMSMSEIARTVMMQRGESVLNMGLASFAKRVFMSTSDFPLIFENVMNKSLQNHYENEQQTWRDQTTRSDVRDFRKKHMYQVGDAPDLLPLGENGEYQAGKFGEAKESMNISTFARSIGMSRAMFINDDMGAFDMMPRMWGAAASRLESDIVWGQILNLNYVLWNLNKRVGDIPSLNHLMNDGKPLFDASHGNLHTGPTSTLSSDGLSRLRQDGHKTKTIDNNRMPVQWGTIVLPYELEDTADELLMARISATKVEDVNKWSGKFDYRVEPRLSDVSDSAWLAFAKGNIKSVEYAYLEGNEGVYTESVQSTDVDGMKSIVRHDFGAGVADHRYIHRSAGK